MKKMVLLFTCAVLCWASPSLAEKVVVTTGAGYKTTLETLAKAYKEKGGSVEEMYGGHIGHMLMQIKAGSGVNVVISDRGTLEETSRGVEFDRFENLGDTLLVLAWRKGLELKSPQDLEKPEVKSVCHPDSKAAIYGRAASEFLKSSGIGDKIADKLSVISSVPQVFAYLTSGEMDAGFVNRAMILNGGDKVGGWIEIAAGYPSLNMVAAVVKGYGNDPEIQDFLNFLRSDQAKAILKKSGIW
jgi:molybdate transport system substrate-binding protein